MSKIYWIAAAVALALWARGSPVYSAEQGSRAGKDKAVEKPTAAKKTDAGEKAAPAGPAVFKLKEVPAFGKSPEAARTSYRYPNGQYARCSGQPGKQVKAYPKLESKKPLYGSVKFDGSYADPGAGIVFHFVLDESGKAAQAEPEKTEKPEPSKSAGGGLLKALARALTGEQAPEPARPKREPVTYDRLYFDLDGDGDLTRHAALRPAKKPPFDLPQETFQRPEEVYFEDLLVPLDFGPGIGKRPVRLVPRARVYGSDRAYLEFIPTVAREGKIRIGKEEHTARLVQSAIISGRFDRPMVELDLSPVGGPGPRQRFSYFSRFLGLVREVHGRLYTLSATPLGDQLTVAPYRGDFGILKIGSGGRTITKLGLLGTLASKDRLLEAGQQTLIWPNELPREHRLPVGDYTPLLMVVDYGRLRISVRSFSPSSEDDGPHVPPVYGIRIRKDKPFVLELSGKPAAVFQKPRKGQAFKPGDTVELEALLTEPHLGVMIAGLTDMGRKKGEIKTYDGQKEIAMPDYERLDPTVIIRNAAGRKVSEGKMPFG